MIELIDFNPEWALLFEKFKEVVTAKTNGLIEEIEHIGSTSIKSAKAKNIIDVQFGVRAFDNIDKISLVLAALGFKIIDSIRQDHVPFKEFDYFEAGWEKRFYKGCFQNQPFNIHVRIIDSPNWYFALNFKKYLTNKPKARYAFMQFKDRLSRSNISKEDYCKIKDSVIDLMSLQF